MSADIFREILFYRAVSTYGIKIYKGCSLIRSISNLQTVEIKCETTEVPIRERVWWRFYRAKEERNLLNSKN